MKKITGEWLSSAKDDLKVIVRAIDDESLTHQVAFHSQQAIEKSLKAIIEEYEIEFIRTHSLETLITKTNSYIELPVDIILLRKLDQLYIDARYPGDLGLLPNGKPDIAEAHLFQQTAEEIFSQVTHHLSK